MFNRVRKRLVLLNALVIVAVLAFLGTLLYAHVRYQLLHDVDETLKLAETRLQRYDNVPDLLRTGQPEPEQDERTTYLFWSEDGELIGQLPVRSFSIETAARFKNDVVTPVIKTVADGSRSYRILSFPSRALIENKTLDVGIVRSLEDTDNTLRTLRWDIFAALLAGALLSIAAGFFLAGKALVPIRSTWDKQQRFVADASHELRTPISIIHVQTEMLLRHPDESIEQQSPGISAILKESKRMNRLVDDLLTLARSDSNLVQIQRSTFALDILLGEIKERFHILASTKDIDIRSDVQAPLTVWGDESRIRQLLIILLDNALKYTPAFGRIELIAREYPHSVNITVSDNGMGIGKDDLPRVFERFYRGAHAKTPAHEGAGLGLSIAKWIMNAHDGTIRVTSKLREGTQVELIFPRKRR